MKIGNKKASTFVYILILINLAFILSVVIMNNSYILNNKMNVWFGNKNLFSNIQNKWEIAINSVKFYNTNWNGFDDSFSCPQSITMSGTFSTWSLKKLELILRDFLKIEVFDVSELIIEMSLKFI